MVLPSQIAEKLTKNEVSAIIKGLAVQYENRISDISELMALLYANNATQQRAPQGARPVPVKKAAHAKQPKEKAAVPPAAPKAEKKVHEKPAPVKKVKAPKEPKESSTFNNNMIPIMAATFGGVIVACFLIFSILYTTVLYKSHDIPFMNSMYSSISFLPMNKDAQDVNNDYSSTTTTQSSSDHERSYVTVPDFKMYTYDSIQSNEVFNRNFTIKYKFQATKEYEKNEVISQSLTAGESVLSGTQITLVISEGITQIELVDVIGMPYQAAKEKLEHAGFVVKQELRKNDGSQTAGEVFLMSKVAGLEFDEGTEIVLSVWDEAETTTKETTTEKEETTTKKKEPATKKTED